MPGFDPMSMPMDPMGMPMGPMGMPMGPSPSRQWPAKAKLGYTNQYGTDAKIVYDGVNAGVNLGFPVGDHQQGLHLGFEGGYGPEGPSAMLRFTKRNVPRVEAPPEQYDPGVMKVLNRYPDAQAAVQEEIGKRQRALIDQSMGINAPGSRKYEFTAGFEPTGMPAMPGMPPGGAFMGMP